jgi:hypothetical protein
MIAARQAADDPVFWPAVVPSIQTLLLRPDIVSCSVTKNLSLCIAGRAPLTPFPKCNRIVRALMSLTVGSPLGPIRIHFAPRRGHYEPYGRLTPSIRCVAR